MVELAASCLVIWFVLKAVIPALVWVYCEIRYPLKKK
jgi:hypothetical protein